MLYLASASAPTALKLTEAIERWGETKKPEETAYSLAMGTELGFFEHLKLLDSPAPLNGLNRLPEAWYDHCASKNLFSRLVPRASPKADRKAIERVMGNFRATIEMLHDYRAKPFSLGCGIGVSIIWAVEATLEKRDVEGMVANKGDSEGLRFLMDRRVDSGTRGWEKLVPEKRVAVKAMEGVNHFSMLVG